jgi:CDP-diacylglycerol--glycerol-3-phosphate 3-phosphatidyltransferase
MDMSLIQRNIPNIITSLRILFSLVFVWFIYVYFTAGLPTGLNNVSQQCQLILCFCLILISDVLDGRVARKMNLVTDFGAKFDVVADLTYVVGAIGVLVYFENLPVWFFVVILFSFIQFIVTSKVLSYDRKSSSLVVFDHLGRMAGILTMLFPGIFVFNFLIIDYSFVLQVGVFVITGLFGVCLFYRSVLVFKLLKKVHKTSF